MKIGMQVCGSDGDILPFLALAGGLSDSGHEVTIVVSSFPGKDYSYIARKHGFEYVELPCSRDESYSRIENWEMLRKRSMIDQVTALYKLFINPSIEDMYHASKKLCQDNDLVISYPLSHMLRAASEKYACPLVMLHCTLPGISTRYMSYSGKQIGTFLNRLSRLKADFFFRRKYGKYVNELRLKEGLAPLRKVSEIYHSPHLNLLAVSESLCVHQADWKDDYVMTGFLYPEAFVSRRKIPGSLRGFLDEGEPPLFMTLGSIAETMNHQSALMLIKVAKLCGRRAIIQSTYKAFHDLVGNDPDIYHLPRAPYEAVFPYCSVIVHHGGAGTVRAALLSGKPSVVVAQAFDNVYWGGRLEELGAAGKCLHGRKVRANEIAAQVQRVLASPCMANRAKVLGERLARENGLSRAVAAIEERFKMLM